MQPLEAGGTVCFTCSRVGLRGTGSYGLQPLEVEGTVSYGLQPLEAVGYDGGPSFGSQTILLHYSLFTITSSKGGFLWIVF